MRGTGAPLAAVPAERTTAPITRWAFYAWMFSLPFDVIVPRWLPLALQGSLSLPRMAGALLAVCFIIDLTTRPWKLPPAIVAFFLFFLMFTASMMRSGFTEVLKVFQQLQFLVLFLICYNLFLTRRALRGALYSFAIASSTASIMMFAGLAEGNLTELETSGREFVFGADPNLYGSLLAIGVLVAIGLAHIRQDKRISSLPFLWGIAVINLLVIAKTASRGTTLGLGLGFLTFILRKGSLMVRLRNLVLLLVVGGVAYAMLGRSELLLSRWTETLETGASSGRDKIFAEAFAMVTEKPLTGWGESALHVLAERLAQPGQVIATHNMVLAILTFTGLIGFLPYLWGYLRIAWACLVSRVGAEDVLPMSIFGVIFTTDMITGGLPDKVHWTFFAYILAADTMTRLTSRRACRNGGR